MGDRWTDEKMGIWKEGWMDGKLMMDRWPYGWEEGWGGGMEDGRMNRR